MSALVVHCRREPYDVYIGRPGPFGNPFVIGRDGTREEVITKYRRWLYERCERDANYRAAVASLRGKVLGCYCAPKACHGDVLTKAAEYYYASE